MANIVGIGAQPNDTTGDTLRDAFAKLNLRLQEIAGTFTGRGDWAPATAYAGTPVRDWVMHAGQAYAATTSHTSSANFAADLEAGKWVSVDLLDLTNTVHNTRVAASMRDAGGVGDGAVSDQAAFELAVGSASDVLVNDGYKFLITDPAVNTRGADLIGGGHIVKATAGGVQKLNSYADRVQRVLGQEYLAAWHNLLIAQHSAPTRKPIIVCSGDSTTAGVGLTDPLYAISSLLLTAGEARGLQTPHGLSCINRGQSGAHTGQWLSTYLAGDLAEAPDLLVLRWGINDPGWLKSGSAAPLDAGQSYPGRRDVDDYLSSLRTGLAQIRAQRDVSSLSIILATPNSTFDTPNGRDALWYEQIIPGIKQAARDFQCCFFDTYSLARDTEHLAGLSMDDPFGDGRGVHPTESFNALIAGALADVVFPRGLQDKIGANGFRVIGGAQWVFEESRTPDMYAYGQTLGRGSTGTGFLLDGAVLTVRSLDDVAMQLNWSYSGDQKRFVWRMGYQSGWGPWSVFGETAAAVQGAGGFENGGMRCVLNGSVVVVDGFVFDSSPGTVAAGTTVAVIPAGFRPVNDAAYGVATLWDGSAFEQRPARVSPDGAVQLVASSSLSVSRVYLCASWSIYA